jgi:hypothetical protein
MSEPQPDVALSVLDVAARLACAPDEVRELVLAGVLDGERRPLLDGSVLVISRRSVQRLIDAKAVRRT